MHFFSSPTSNILPSTFAPASVAMSRSDSRDSATSTTSSTGHHYAWDVRPRSSPTFSSSSSSKYSHAHEPSHRRTSSSSSSSSSAGWTPSPYRSCLSQVEDSSSSYLSDDDLLDLPIDIIEAPVQRELSTEEQIEMLRAYREREESQFSHGGPHPHHHHNNHHHHGPMRGALHHPAAKPELWFNQHHQQYAQQQQQQQQQKKSRVVRFAAEQGARTSPSRRRPSALRRS
jgi:hypothetical protein